MSVTQLEKLQRTLPEVFGQLALLMQHKAMLQATANTNGLPRCRTATMQCSVIITRLRHNIQARNDETSHTWEDWLEFNRQLKSKPHIGRPPQSTRGSQLHLVVSPLTR